MQLSIRWKLLFVIALPIVLVYAVMIVGVLTNLERRAQLAVEDRLTETAMRHAASFDAVLRELAQVARSTAVVLEAQVLSTPEAIDYQLHSNVMANPVCYGAAVAFEPYVFDEAVELYGPYAYRDGDVIESMDIAVEAYDYTDPQWEWYQQPKTTGKPGWSAPYFDDGAGNILMSTYSVPFFRAGKLAGVTSVDISLEALGREISASFPRDLDFFVLTSSGQYVYHSDTDLIMESSIFDQADELDRPELRALGEAMTTGQSGIQTIETDEGAQWLVFAQIESAGWSIAAGIDEDDALASVRSQVAWLASVLGATLILIALCVWMASGWITRPLRRLTAVVRQVASGDLDADAPDDERGDEIGALSRSFNHMRGDFKGLMRRRAEEEAASRDAIIFSLARLAESRDNETGQHLERICKYVEILARELAKDRDDIDDYWIRTITTTAALHDIGKVGVPDAVLLKPGRLTEEEHRVIQKHTTVGGDTLLAIKQRYHDDTFLRTATEIAFAHHERWDGTGYPFGLAAEDIALSARIVSVADVYDALTSKRVYKPGMSHEKASGIIIEGSGTQFDPEVVAAFQRVDEEIRRTAAELQDG